MPPGDPHEVLRLSQSRLLSLSNRYMRVDRQTLQRLSLFSAIVFNFKALFIPMSELRDEPGVPKLLAKILKEHVVLPELEKWSEEQDEKGLMEKGWEVHTLGESSRFKG
ncbi:hypothetical protein PAAG_04129 [Paracoccidioides lutzii Pb01]|uniref:Uncharacterized protein n=1 Tax=Paracoccidioides lutzii (strain ATCC MYA-826 / Pb01) TaxID=502779 RepID=C1H035_PARBA|nr:hypothetical protein PAAG_04129 [Paracoccidioides lutzii Pb01]EEH33076.1 hypothetical protein PAAG_04129 [Paracoccidioides lutzii Pb01]